MSNPTDITTELNALLERLPEKPWFTVAADPMKDYTFVLEGDPAYFSVVCDTAFDTLETDCGALPPERTAQETAQLIVDMINYLRRVLPLALKAGILAETLQEVIHCENCGGKGYDYFPSGGGDGYASCSCRDDAEDLLQNTRPQLRVALLEIMGMVLDTAAQKAVPEAERAVFNKHLAAVLTQAIITDCTEAKEN